MPLEGWQLSFLPQVECYELVNPPAPVSTAGWLGSIGCEQVADDFDAEEIVLGGQLDFGLVQMQGQIDPAAETLTTPEAPIEIADPLAPKFETKARGWIGWKETKRERKNRDAWICRQAWLYWEEPGGKKRSRYIPKGKLAAVEESVYGLRRSIVETLELLN